MGIWDFDFASSACGVIGSLCFPVIGHGASGVGHTAYGLVNWGIMETISCFTPHYEGLRRPDLRFTTESQRTQRTVFFLRPGGDGRRKEPPPVAKAL